MQVAGLGDIKERVMEEDFNKSDEGQLFVTFLSAQEIKSGLSEKITSVGVA